MFDDRSLGKCGLKPVNVLLQNVQSVGVGFHQNDPRSAQHQSAKSQNTVTGSQIEDGFSFKTVQFLDGQQPVGGQIAFGRILLKRDVGARMRLQF